MRALVVAALALLQGCSTWQAPAPLPVPEPTAPAAWTQQAGTEQPAPFQPWLQTLESPALHPLVAEALAQNPELAQARSRLAASQAQARVAGADQALQASAALNASRNRRSGVTASSFNAALELAWEADLWGRLAAGEQAAWLSAEALAADLHAAELSLAANVAKAWFAAIEAQLQLQLSQQLVKNLTENLDILNQSYQSGLVNALDIHLARANLASEQARLAAREQARGDSLRTLERFLGRYPAGALATATDLPALSQPVNAGVPGSLLTRRPDLQAALLRLQSANAELARAHKERLPGLRLTGSLGGSSSDLENLLRGDSLIWSALLGLSQPLLNGDRLAARVDQRRAEAQGIQAAYRATLLNAFSEVESALQQERHLQQQVSALRQSRAESDYAEELAFEQYRAGLVDFITVLEAQRRAFNARAALLQARGALLQNRINLYLALGGGFATEHPPTAEARSSGSPSATAP